MSLQVSVLSSAAALTVFKPTSLIVFHLPGRGRGRDLSPQSKGCQLSGKIGNIHCGFLSHGCDRLLVQPTTTDPQRRSQFQEARGPEGGEGGPTSPLRGTSFIHGGHRHALQCIKHVYLMSRAGVMSTKCDLLWSNYFKYTQ